MWSILGMNGRKEEWWCEDGKCELKAAPQLLLKFYTTLVSIPQVMCEEVKENRGTRVLPGRVAPSWGCWGCVEGAVSVVMVVTRVGPEKGKKKRKIKRYYT